MAACARHQGHRLSFPDGLPVRPRAGRLVPGTGEGAAAQVLWGWLVLAGTAAGVAGLLATAVALARLPGVRVLSAQGFYSLLVGHVVFSLIVWLLSAVTAVGVYVVGSAFPPLAGWVGLGLASGGSVLLLAASVTGRGRPILSDYMPVVDTPAYLGGAGLFAAGVAVTLGAVGYAAMRRASRSLPRVGMTAVAATFAVATAALLPPVLRPERPSYQALFWGAGHALQYAYAATMAVAWYVLARAGLGAASPAPGLSRRAFALYPLLALLAPLPYLVVDPEAVPRLQPVNVALGLGTSVPTLVHLALVSSGVAAVLRTPAARRMPLWRPETTALGASWVFYILGGLLAPVATRGTLQVTAHYHAMLVGGVTVALMGMAYHMLDVKGWAPRRRGAAVAHLALFAVGVLCTVVVLAWAGVAGAPRKMYGGAGGQGPWASVMRLMIAASAPAVLGGALFVADLLGALVRARTGVRRARPAHAAEVLGP
jgi:hypothetical protein